MGEAIAEWLSGAPLSRSAPFLVGKTYGDSKFHFPRAIVCGIIDGDGRVRMLPPRDWLLSKEDRIVALARDRNDLVPKRIIKPPRLNVDQKQVKRAVTAAASADVVSAAEQGGGAGSSASSATERDRANLDHRKLPGRRRFSLLGAVGAQQRESAQAAARGERSAGRSERAPSAPSPGYDRPLGGPARFSSRTGRSWPRSTTVSKPHHS